MLGEGYGCTELVTATGRSLGLLTSDWRAAYVYRRITMSWWMTWMTRRKTADMLARNCVNRL